MNTEDRLFSILGSGSADQTREKFYTEPMERTPEQKLYEALLQGAIQEIRDPRTRQSTLSQTMVDRWREDALEWVSNEASYYIFSFEVCCEQLNLSPAAVRKVILAEAEIGTISTKRRNRVGKYVNSISRRRQHQATAEKKENIRRRCESPRRTGTQESG